MGGRCGAAPVLTRVAAALAALAVPQLTERLVQVDTLSNTYAFTDFRLGWSVAPEPIARVYAARREIVVEQLGAIPGVEFAAPEGAFYAFFRHGVDLSSADVRTALADRGVLLRAGSEYGPSGEGYLRMSFAASEEDIREGIRRTGQGLAELRG